MRTAEPGFRELEAVVAPGRTAGPPTTQSQWTTERTRALSEASSGLEPATTARNKSMASNEPARMY